MKASPRLRRLLCWLLGHRRKQYRYDASACLRCGAPNPFDDFDDPNWRKEYGILRWPWNEARWHFYLWRVRHIRPLRRWVLTPCDECRKPRTILGCPHGDHSDCDSCPF